MAGRVSLQVLLSSIDPVVSARPRQTVETLTVLPNSDVTFMLNETLYLGKTPRAEASLPIEVSSLQTALVTVLDIQSCSINASIIDATIQNYLLLDDVFCSAFLDNLILTSTCAEAIDMHNDVSEYVAAINSTILAVLDNTSTNNVNRPLPGPYIGQAADGQLALGEVYIIYQDRYRDFLYGVTPNVDEDTYEPLRLFHMFSTDPYIPVPSRIYSFKDSRPLAGVRIGVKDLYDIAGTTTSAGSRAWTEISQSAGRTAPSIQRLIDLGAVIVGKQKLAQFASGADPWDWTDVQYPFNPRGDGYLSCAASSSGGGCSIAAYDWLDVAIGSDTGCSMRAPASVSGTFGNRPSQGIMSLEGVVPLGAAMDTAGLFARDPILWSRIAKQWYTPSLYQQPSINGLEPLNVSAVDDIPKVLKLDPAYLPTRNPAAETLVQDFLGNMTSILNITIQIANLTALLLSSSVEAVKNITIRNQSTSTLISYTHWNEVSVPLLASWAKIDERRLPPVDPFWRPFLIDQAPANITYSDYNHALHVKRGFSEWMNHDFLGNGNPAMGSCADSSLWIYDIGTGGLPLYREQDLLIKNPNTTGRFGITPPDTIMPGMLFCSVGGCADYTVPIGQVEYFSEVSRVVEMVPVTVSLVAKRGCDFVLFDLLERLAEAGLIQAVRVGRTAF